MTTLHASGVRLSTSQRDAILFVVVCVVLLSFALVASVVALATLPLAAALFAG